MSDEVTISGWSPTPGEVHNIFMGEVRTGLNLALLDVQAEVQRRMPFATGHARRSVTVTIKSEGDVLTGEVGSNVDYVGYLEAGTGIYGPRGRPIVPVHAKALRFPAGGQASLFSGGQRRQAKPGKGFRLSGAQRAGKAGAGAQFAYRRSVRGIRPRRMFADSRLAAEAQVQRRMDAIGPRITERLRGAR